MKVLDFLFSVCEPILLSKINASFSSCNWSSRNKGTILGNAGDTYEVVLIGLI